MNTTPALQQHGSPRSAQRSLTPDLARGLMLLLIAMANVMIYLHGRPYGPRQHIVEDGGVDIALTGLMTMFVDTRAYPMFALLFGYGLAKIIENQRKRGTDHTTARKLVRRRSIWLILFGAVHAAFGFSGDILGWYGLLAVVIIAMLGLKDRTLLWAAGAWLVIASAVQGLIYSQTAITNERSFFWSYAVDDGAYALALRGIEWLMTPFGLLAVASPLLVGVVAARHRILEEPANHLPLLRRTAVFGISAGVLGGIGMTLVSVHAVDPPFAVVAVLSWLHVMTGVFCGIGYAALIGLWAVRIQHRSGPHLPWTIRALQATGARSLSSYLAQTLVFVPLLPAWTLGWGATLSTSGAAALATATWALTVVGAAYLDRRGGRGPAEALLKRVVYGPSNRPNARATLAS